MEAFQEERPANKDILIEKGLPIAFPAHWHDFIEVVFVYNGIFTVGINDEKYTLEVNDLLIINRNHIHYYSDETKGEFFFLIMNPQLLKDDISFSDNITPYLSRQTLADKGLDVIIFEIFTSLFNSYTEQDGFWQPFSKGLCLLLFSYLYRYFPAGNANKNEPRRLEKFRNLLLYLGDNFNQNIKLEDGAKRLNYSPWYFSKLFKAYTGYAFSNYMNNIKIHESEKLLIGTDKTIADIATKCGFNSIRNFNREFKKFHNITPTDFRCRNKSY